MMALLFSFENLYRQYLACRRNKRNTLNALRFEARHEQNLLDLQDALQSRSYAPARSVCFYVNKPKLREIFAADFRDRVVHHVLVDYLERIWEPIFIHDSYACRKGKGIHAGVKRLRQFIRQVTANGSRPAWYLQMDIRNYFMSIDKDILFALLKAKLDDYDALWLTRVLVFHDCTADYIIKVDPAMLKHVPPHKTLFGAAPDKGLPIGNLNSQFFANVYLNALDQFVKHQLKCRYYLRYCDDFVLLSPDREQLALWREQISQFLAERLQLELNGKREKLRPVGDGVDFLGYIVRADYLLVRRRVVNNLRERLQEFERVLVRQRSSYRLYRYDVAALDTLAACLSSYLGHFKQADTFLLCRRLWREFPYLGEYFDFDVAHRRLLRCYPAVKNFRRVLGQYRYFRGCFPDDVLFFQVGRFIEFYGEADQSIAVLLGLGRISENRRGALWGFPLVHARYYLRRLVKAGFNVTCIVETGRYLNKILVRRVVCRFVCHQTPRHIFSKQLTRQDAIYNS